MTAEATAEIDVNLNPRRGCGVTLAAIALEQRFREAERLEKSTTEG